MLAQQMEPGPQMQIQHEPEPQQEQTTRRGSLNNKAKPCLLAFLLMTALGLSVWSFVIVQDEDWNKESTDFENSLTDEIEAFGNKSEARIVRLVSEIKAFKISYLNSVSDAKSSVGSRIGKLYHDLLNVQTELSTVQSDVEGLRGDLTKLEDDMADEHSKVWAEFTKLTNKLNDL